MVDIVDMLKKIACPVPGELIPLDVGSGTVPEAYNAFVAKICADAITEIEHLRTTIANLQQIAGKASIERPFSEIQKEIRSSFNEKDKEMRSTAGLDNG